MRRWVMGVVCAVGVALAAPVGAQQDRSAEEAEILGMVTTLFDGMRERDGEKLRGLFHPEARLGTNSVEGWITSVEGATAYLDEVTFDEEVRIDGDLAMAWTPYNLFVDDRFQHCGVDLFTFVRVEGAWKILQLADTRRQEGCDPERRG